MPECEARIRAVTSELVTALRDRRNIAEELGLATAQYTRARNRLHLMSKSENEGFTIPDHEAWVETRIEQQYDDVGFTMRLAKARQQGLNVYIDGLQTIIEVLRSALKTAREIS